MIRLMQLLELFTLLEDFEIEAQLRYSDLWAKLLDLTQAAAELVLTGIPERYARGKNGLTSRLAEDCLKQVSFRMFCNP